VTLPASPAPSATPSATGGAASAPRGRGPKLLFVDDEPSVLEGISANLRRNFDVQTASSGALGLEILKFEPSIAVVVSDMRMPHMNGAQFLTAAREVAPNAVRMLLTGHTDIESAVAAVNKGQIFRFLTKPCARDDLRAAVDAAVEQHRLVHAEKELLEQTLRGSVKALVDILALTNPGAFGRANRIKTHVLELAAQMGVTETWQLEVAALTSQLGYITLPHDLWEKLVHHHQLTEDERKLVAKAPEAGAQLLDSIPRLEAVREILSAHVKPPRRDPNATPHRKLVEVGAHLLRFALDYDDQCATSPARAIEVMRSRADLYDADVRAAFDRACGLAAARPVKELTLVGLRVGMTFADDVRMASGALLVACGYEITPSFLQRVRSFPFGALTGPFKVYG
jgi:FixJ family two-component response regulator